MNENLGERFPTKTYPNRNEDITLGLRFGEASAVAFSLAKGLPRRPKWTILPAAPF